MNSGSSNGRESRPHASVDESRTSTRSSIDRRYETTAKPNAQPGWPRNSNQGQVINRTPVTTSTTAAPWNFDENYTLRPVNIRTSSTPYYFDDYNKQTTPDRRVVFNREVSTKKPTYFQGDLPFLNADSGETSVRKNLQFYIRRSNKNKSN